MTLNPVPLAISGGAELDAPLLRTLAWSAVRGENGVMAPGHLLVTPTSTPSGSVTVNPGVGVASNSYASTLAQTYVGSNDTATDVAIAPTTSAGGKTSYVILSFRDPQYESFTPTDVGQGPYVFLEEVTSFPAYPYVLLARITMPASTATVTAAMIDSGPSVREVANPRNTTLLTAWNGSGRATTAKQWAMSTGEGYWLPATETQLLRLECPAWAGTAVLKADIGGVAIAGKDCQGYIYLRVINTANRAQYVNLPLTSFDLITDTAQPGQTYRDGYVLNGTVAIPAAMRGQTLEFTLVGSKGNGASGASLWLGSGSAITVTAYFAESAVEEIL